MAVSSSFPLKRAALTVHLAYPALKTFTHPAWQQMTLHPRPGSSARVQFGLPGIVEQRRPPCPLVVGSAQYLWYIRVRYKSAIFFRPRARRGTNFCEPRILIQHSLELHLSGTTRWPTETLPHRLQYCMLRSYYPQPCFLSDHLRVPHCDCTSFASATRFTMMPAWKHYLHCSFRTAL